MYRHYVFLPFYLFTFLPLFITFAPAMKIGNIEFGERPLFLAPMEDVTDIGFRKLCKRFGAFPPLVKGCKTTGEAAKIVEQSGPDIIDLNFGCPVKKVAGKGAGAGMLRNIPLLLDITREVVKAVKTPVTVKTRLGWDQQNLIITTLAEQLQDCGIQALTIHGRTRSQMYTGDADWTLIGEVKRNPRIHIPIIGNGDIRTPEEAANAFDRYGVDGVMVGRATFGAPWIFQEMRDKKYKALIAAAKKQGKDTTAIFQEMRDALTTSLPHREGRGGSRAEVGLSISDKIDILLEQLHINVERIDERRGIIHTRRHLASTPVFKGIPDFRQTRIAMLRAETVSELTAILEQCRERLKG